MSIYPEKGNSIERLLEGIHEGDFAIPLFQRNFEWAPNQVKDLLTSIISNYFSGLLLFWELDHKKISEKELQLPWGTTSKGNQNFAILDGQQRLSSLYYALYNPDIAFPNKQSYYLFFVDIQKALEGNYDDSIIYTYSKEHIPTNVLKERVNEYIGKNIFPLALLSDVNFIDTQLKDWVRGYAKNIVGKSGDSSSSAPDAYSFALVDTIQEINDLLSGIRKYKFTSHTLDKSKDIKDVCLMFARLNQKGLRLSMFDLMNAFLYGKGIRLRKSYDDVDESLKKITDLDEYLLKSMALYKREYSSPKYVYALVPGYEDIQRKDGKKVKVITVKTAGEFIALWNDAIKYNEKARWRIQNNGENCFGAIKVDFIPNTTMIPVLASVLKEYEVNFSRNIVENQFDKVISKWYWSAVFSQDYSGSSDTVMSKDYRELKEWLKTGNPLPIERISQEKLDQTVSNIKLLNERKGSSIYNAVISLLALRQAEDFFTRAKPGFVDYAESSINDHHIFPAKVTGLEDGKSKQFVKTKDNILNRTLLLDKTNQSISNDKPSVYLEKILKQKLGGDEGKLRQIMNSHFISDKAFSHLWNDDYDHFIEEREKSILVTITDLLR
jgi:hypothetical protein